MERTPPKVSVKNEITSRKRSGSFSGTLTGRMSTGWFSSREVGQVHYHYSATANEGRINMLENTSAKSGTNIGGVGQELSKRTDTFMKQQGATAMKIQPVGNERVKTFWEKQGYHMDVGTYQQKLAELQPLVSSGAIDEPTQLREAAKKTDYWSKSL